MRCLIITALALTVVACNDNDGADVSPEQQALDSNQTLWSNQGFTHYQYTYSVGCFCLPEENIVVVVEDNVVTDAFYTPSGLALTEERKARLLIVEELFAIVQDAIDSEADELRVEYDGTRGFPTTIDIDYSHTIADDEILRRISNFQ